MTLCLVLCLWTSFLSFFLNKWLLNARCLHKDVAKNNDMEYYDTQFVTPFLNSVSCLCSWHGLITIDAHCLSRKPVQWFRLHVCQRPLCPPGRLVWPERRLWGRFRWAELPRWRMSQPPCQWLLSGLSEPACWLQGRTSLALKHSRTPSPLVLIFNIHPLPTRLLKQSPKPSKGPDIDISAALLNCLTQN